MCVEGTLLVGAQFQNGGQGMMGMTAANLQQAVATNQNQQALMLAQQQQGVGPGAMVGAGRIKLNPDDP